MKFKFSMCFAAMAFIAIAAPMSSPALQSEQSGDTHLTGPQSQEEGAPKPPAYTVLYTFTGGADGAAPNIGAPGRGLIFDEEGNLYGTTTGGGDFCVGAGGCGVVFKLDQAGKETVLHDFTGSPDGAFPYANVIRDEEGNLYGTTGGGGSSALPSGTVFKLHRDGKEIVLHSFTGVDGNTPLGGVIRDEEGNLYGTTLGGGAFGPGVVFMIDGRGEETVLHSFTGGTDGGGPSGDLIRDKEGNLYGTTGGGGSSGHGIVFKLDRTGKETVLYSFTGGADGAFPVAGVIRDEEGSLYGITQNGGIFGGGCAGIGSCGVVFKLDRTGKETVVYTFTGGADGSSPAGRLFRHGGHLYGTTEFGGDLNGSGCGGLGCGVVFTLDQAGRQTVLYSFTGGADGANPTVGLVRDEEGNFYGTTTYGGDSADGQAPCYGYGCGVVFKLKPDDHREDREEGNEILRSPSDASRSSNPAGAITRRDVDASDLTHGFVRSRAGGFIHFEVAAHGH